ncbi:spore germination protein KA [Ruminococcaceae bacterium FB2012]|nr:spore germination protein KA [Ruminococcaceae bacterium FB2012]
MHPIPKTASDFLSRIKNLLGQSADLNTAKASLSGVTCVIASIEGMASAQLTGELVLAPLARLAELAEGSGQKLFRLVTAEAFFTADIQQPATLEDASALMFSGFALLFVEGGGAAAFGVQGFDKKAVTEPTGEHNIMGSQEGFCEAIRSNVSLVRRRMKTPSLRLEMLKAGQSSNTDICLCYLAGRADSSMISDLKRRVKNVGLDTVLASGSLRPFLEEGSGVGLFSELAATERPDVVCARINEGRAALLIDGSPFALICPALFGDNFRTVDDACSKPCFVVLMRLVRYIAFFFAVMFPGIYVAVANYHPEMLTLKLLLNLTASERSTPYSLFVEMLIITVLLELMKEAAVRMPRAVGSAISIAGGLVIGDAAVKSGIISSPLLIIVGLTATASFVIPSLAQQSSVLRLVYICAGGTAGFFGIAAVSAMVMTNACASDSRGIPFTAPLLPFTKRAAAEVLIRKSPKKAAEEHSVITELRDP